MSMLPAMALSGGLGLAQSVASLIPTAADKLNKERLKALQKLEEDGQLGLTDEERNKKDAALMAPVRAAATQAAEDNRRTQAATGITTGQSLATAQRVAGETQGRAAMGAKEYLDQLDTQKEEAQKNEIEQRTANKSARNAEKRQQFFSGLSQTAGEVGKLAGAPPEQTKMYGLFGGKVRDPQSALQVPTAASQADRSYIADLVSRSGDKLNDVLLATERNKTSDPSYDPQLRVILDRFRTLQTLQGLGLSGAPAAPQASPSLVLPASTLYDQHGIMS